jgi:hypothetical protein
LAIPAYRTRSDEYGILHDHNFGKMSLAAYAAGAAVALFGRNEGGKVLHREAVLAVLERVHSIDYGSGFFAAKTVLPSFTRVVTMAVSDVNKRHMLQFQPLVDILLAFLIIHDGNRRKGQDGADALQEASAGVLHELALFGPGAAVLRADSRVVPTLHTLCDVGTEVAKERGAAALFELELEKRTSAVALRSTVLPTLDHHEGSGVGARLQSPGRNSPPPPLPHVMASYNWDHQEVILRVVASLQHRGYLVWVDTEQMKGATVDTMALAVEGSAVVLIGVSRAYKESSNCRMEAQYALQRKKPLVPLMLVQGYEADGWLGLLLGTSLWYQMYGATLTSEGVFEDRIDSLCRELGSRGHTDAAAVPCVTPSAGDGVLLGGELEPEPEQQQELHCPEGRPGLEQELRELKLMALRTRALSVGLDSAIVDDAMDDATDPRMALVALILASQA